MINEELELVSQSLKANPGMSMVFLYEYGYFSLSLSLEDYFKTYKIENYSKFFVLEKIGSFLKDFDIHKNQELEGLEVIE